MCRMQISEAQGRKRQGMDLPLAGASARLTGCVTAQTCESKPLNRLMISWLLSCVEDRAMEKALHVLQKTAPPLPATDCVRLSRQAHKKEEASIRQMLGACSRTRQAVDALLSSYP